MRVLRTPEERFTGLPASGDGDPITGPILCSHVPGAHGREIVAGSVRGRA